MLNICYIKLGSLTGPIKILDRSREKERESEREKEEEMERERDMEGKRYTDRSMDNRYIYPSNFF